MEQVLDRRDENRIAQRRYVFDETERFTVTAYDGEVYQAYTREYVWYRRDGVFVRSPVRIDGVVPSEADWRRYEADWLEAEAGRTRDRRGSSEDPCMQGDDAPEPPPATGGAQGDDATSDLAAAADLRPRFLSESYWLDFEFEPGNSGSPGAGVAQALSAAAKTVGLRFFYDTAAVYEAARPLQRVRCLEGAGAGVFFTPPRFGFPVSIDVAHDFAGGVRVHGSAGFGFRLARWTQSPTCGSMTACSRSLSARPTTDSTTLPSLKSSRVGIDRTPYCPGVAGLSSTFILPTVTRPS